MWEISVADWKKLNIHKDKAPPDIWNRYFDANYDGNDYVRCKNRIVSYYDNKNENEIYVYQCIFTGLSSTIIRVSTDGFNILHSYCLFNNCNHPDAGAILINGHNSITQYRFCTTNIFGAAGQYIYKPFIQLFYYQLYSR